MSMKGGCFVKVMFKLFNGVILAIRYVTWLLLFIIYSILKLYFLVWGTILAFVVGLFGRVVNVVKPFRKESTHQNE